MSSMGRPARQVRLHSAKDIIRTVTDPRVLPLESYPLLLCDLRHTGGGGGGSGPDSHADRAGNARRGHTEDHGSEPW